MTSSEATGNFRLNLRAGLYIAATLAAVVVGSRVGVAIVFPPTNISAFWPPNAILLAALLLMGESPRKLCLFLAYPAYCLGDLWSDGPVALTLVFSLANWLEVTVALYLIRRYGGARFDFTKLSQLLLFVATAIAASLVSGFVGPGFVALTGGQFGETFLPWFLGNLMGFLVFTPLVLTLPAWRDWLPSAPRLEKAEAALVASVILVLSLAVYGPYVPGVAGLGGALFLPIPVMLWAAMRCGTKGAAISGLGVSLIAVTFAIQGHGPFSQLDPVRNVESLQLFITSVVLASLAVSVLINERNNADEALARSRDELEESIQTRTLELRESEQRFRDFALSSADRFWEMDADLRFTSFYEPGRIDPTPPREFLIGKTRWEGAGVDPDSDPKWRAHRDDMLARRPFRDFVYQLAPGPASDIWWRVSGVPVFDADGIFTGYRGIGSDISEQMLLQEKLARTQRMEAVGQLTGGVAHDFNNLMASIMLDAGLLKRRLGDDEEGQSIAEHIRSSIDRGKSLTERLLAFSRQQTLLPSASDITGRISGLDDMLRRTLGETVDLRVVSTANLWPAMTDPHQFESALVNLAINARDAMPKGGTLVIETANVTLDESYTAEHEDVAPGDYVKIAVRDSGTGMTPEVQERAFEPFFTTKEIGQGSGLGLSMVYGFAKQSMGHITVDSAVGHGTTVTLYLPRSLEAAVDTTAAGESAEIPRGSERILVVEDDKDVRQILVTILRENGYEVVGARSGREAVGHLKSGLSFDFLFTDLVLPGGMNGTEIADEAKRLQPHLGILFTTGYAENALPRGGRLDPDVGLIQKPYRQEELLRKLRSLLDLNPEHRVKSKQLRRRIGGITK